MIVHECARLALLGGFCVEYAGVYVRLPVNVQRLLAFLGVHGASPRSVVAGTLWPEVTEQNAHGSLRTTVWRARRDCPDLIDCSGERLSLHPTVTVDSRVLADAALAAIYGNRFDGAIGPVLTHDAELLPGWYDDWVIYERERLRQLRLHALEALAEWLTAKGDYGGALNAALETVRVEPLRESAQRIVIAIHLAENNVVEAVRHYASFRDLLRSELGIKPSAQLTAMLPKCAHGSAPAL